MSKRAQLNLKGLAALTLAAAAIAAPIPSAFAIRGGRDRKRQRPQGRPSSELQREIAEWNAAVEARKAAKREAKQQREAA